MPVLVGIDEAGYGPTLGPLVVAATAWHLPLKHVASDLWELLDEAVSRTAERSARRLVVGDSKQVYDRKRGIHTLERTVLAFAAQAEVRARTLAEFLQALGTAVPAAHLPWYADLAIALPRDAARSACTGAAVLLHGALVRKQIRCLGMRAEVLTEDVYNEQVSRTRNKHLVVLEAVLRLIDWAGRLMPAEDLHVHVDRLGGRVDYRPALMQAFPQRHLHVEQVGDALSRYRLAAARTDWFVQFAVDGDQQQLPIALASMLAKYVREVMMECFNAYWCQRSPALRATAGYYRDAERFLQDIGPLLAAGGPPTRDFVRSR